MQDTLDELRNLTGFELRADYLDLIREYPSALRGMVRAEDGSDCEGQVDTVELISNPLDILDINLEVRADSVEHPAGHEFLWPDQVLAIGENGEGDYYGIDLANEYRGVLFFDHQETEFEEITESLQDFVELLKEAFPA